MSRTAATAPSSTFHAIFEKSLKAVGMVNINRSVKDLAQISIRQVFSPAQIIFAGAGVLLSAAKDVQASEDVLIDIFERIKNFFERLEVTKVPPTQAMTNLMVKIIVEVLDILGAATKETKQSRASEVILRLRRNSKKRGGNKKAKWWSDRLKRLDKMTNEEARMANAEMMRIAHDMDKTVKSAERKQLRESLKRFRWQSPSDPSTNHNFACDRQHRRTAEWFCKGTVFEKWKATGSLLWDHGKHMHFSLLNLDGFGDLTHHLMCSGLWEEHSMVR
ncbi:hypothetical protein V8E53_008296 [Lactarius tabidus]